MNTQQINNWLDDEAKATEGTSLTGERFPALKLEENKITDITIDVSVPFNKWTDEKTKAVKALIPVTHKGEKKIWWVNVKNPIYSKIIQACREGKTTLKVLQTGNQATTRYAIVE